MADWNPEKYLGFAQERALPAQDLIARISHLQPRQTVDLGCGPGNSTALLRQAFRDTSLLGIDSSAAMIDRARSAVPDAAFERADAASWLTIGTNFDLVFSNALFQWVPQHEQLVLRILRNLKRGAVLALQMPDNLNEPSHRMMLETASRGAWRGLLNSAVESRSTLLSASAYHELFEGHATALEIWRTTYHHLLDGHQGIVDMLSTTGLRPFLEPLPDDQCADFIERYKRAITPHYPLLKNGKLLFPFPRLFIVAVSAGS
jgi:trans-aconitate 2-methyltransferase